MAGSAASTGNETMMTNSAPEHSSSSFLSSLIPAEAQSPLSAATPSLHNIIPSLSSVEFLLSRSKIGWKISLQQPKKRGQETQPSPLRNLQNFTKSPKLRKIFTRIPHTFEIPTLNTQPAPKRLPHMPKTRPPCMQFKQPSETVTPGWNGEDYSPIPCTFAL